jgi:hypothetical protein
MKGGKRRHGRSWGGKATNNVCFIPESDAEGLRGRSEKDVPYLDVFYA